MTGLRHYGEQWCRMFEVRIIHLKTVCLCVCWLIPGEEASGKQELWLQSSPSENRRWLHVRGTEQAGGFMSEADDWVREKRLETSLAPEQQPTLSSRPTNVSETNVHGTAAPVRGHTQDWRCFSSIIQKRNEVSFQKWEKTPIRFMVRFPLDFLADPPPWFSVGWSLPSLTELFSMSVTCLRLPNSEDYSKWLKGSKYLTRSTLWYIRWAK